MKRSFKFPKFVYSDVWPSCGKGKGEKGRGGEGRRGVGRGGEGRVGGEEKREERGREEGGNTRLAGRQASHLV